MLKTPLRGLPACLFDLALGTDKCYIKTMTFTINEPLKAISGPTRIEYDKDENARVEDYGPVPENPFTRLREDRGLSINQLAIHSRVNNKALTRLEKGMYVNPLPRMVDYWVSIGTVTEGELCTDYENYRYLQRKRHPFYLGASLAVDITVNMHPLRQLRLARPSIADGTALPVGLMDFCDALCLPLDSIQHFEKKFATQQSVPKELKLALNQIGYSRQQISTFETHYTLWRSNNLKQVKVSNG